MEDDLSLQALYKKMLSLSGFEIIGVANNGEEAVKIYKTLNHKPDIILMDHRMPIKNGIEAMQEILELERDSEEKPQVVFASADKTIRRDALAAGAVEFLDKPFSFKKLTNKIKEILEKRMSDLQQAKWTHELAKRFHFLILWITLIKSVTILMIL